MRPLLFLIGFLVFTSLAAQVAAPDFLCTRSDAGTEVLRWNNVASGCGPFQATEILTATDRNGPYTLLAALTDPSTTEYADPNPAGQMRFYFLRYRYDCPGQAVINSDTLDNLIPLTPVVQFAGVEGNEIVLSWLPSRSPEVSGYNVLEVTPNSIDFVATVSGATEFRLPFLASDPAPATRQFRLVAIDPCGNDSPQGTIVRPMDLTGAGGTGCGSDITLQIDQAARANYLPATALELFVSVDGAAAVSAGTFPPDATSINYRNANDGEDLAFYVEAVLANGLGRARSTVFRQTVNITQPIRDFPLYGASFEADGSVLLRYAEPASPTALDAFSALLGQSGNRTTEIPLTGTIFGSGGVLTLPTLPAPLAEGETLRLRLADACGREVTTNAVQPVFLSGRALAPGNNLLNWSPLVNNLPGSLSYDIHRAIVADAGAAAGAVFEPIAMDVEGTSYADALDPGQGMACYLIIARFLPASAVPVATQAFRSNVVCVAPPTEVYLPNAFSPSAREAANRVFQPFFSSLPESEGYALLVFDRWGGLLFESQDPTAGWSGDRSGQPLPSGAYLYQLRYRTANGAERLRTGVVNLIR
ncbi:gliding motility-associated C-terminal domain-containing protein [Neolewinella lacunae]|uniref:Gliding motility-associated C-terminal domain-containing protein n=1 Tax=Neolewinella lacunae TaxID=1517758 RepID=A0A923PN78_9BACT|nr:gliding motility-associated C-terminal domain-containing protein [Neolewinella lacunae]MBC6994399.1 gliding motility-associated C-terminal domain-containing protein [Neolewinella lacunae]MDN3633330.1 gliding motility-associated C-terminal domain-containing protein [Neolewinella lacunae]